MTSAAEPFADPSVAYAWGTKGHSGVFAVPGHGHLFTALWLVETEAEMQLQTYLLDEAESCVHSDNLDLGPDWGDDGGNRRQTCGGRLPLLQTDGGIDTTPAAKLADEAMAALKRALE